MIGNIYIQLSVDTTKILYFVPFDSYQCVELLADIRGETWTRIGTYNSNSETGYTLFHKVDSDDIPDLYRFNLKIV